MRRDWRRHDSGCQRRPRADSRQRTRNDVSLGGQDGRRPVSRGLGGPGRGTSLGKIKAACGVGPAGAVIMVVGRDAGARQTLYRELSRRYGADYRIVVCGEPAELEPPGQGPAGARHAGRAGHRRGGCSSTRTASRCLPRSAPSTATAPRVAAVRWGDFGDRAARLRRDHGGQGRPLGDAARCRARTRSSTGRSPTS